MELALLIYLIDVFCSSDGSPPGYGFVGGLLSLLWIGGIIISKGCEVEKDKKSFELAFPALFKSLWPLKILAVLFCLIGIFMPTKEAAYTMMAAYGLQSIAQNDRVKELGGKSLEVLEKYMDDYLEEGKTK